MIAASQSTYIACPTYVRLAYNIIGQTGDACIHSVLVVKPLASQEYCHIIVNDDAVAATVPWLR
jgi:hypothetical protein